MSWRTRKLVNINLVSAPRPEPPHVHINTHSGRQARAASLTINISLTIRSDKMKREREAARSGGGGDGGGVSWWRGRCHMFISPNLIPSSLQTPTASMMNNYNWNEDFSQSCPNLSMWACGLALTGAELQDSYMEHKWPLKYVRRTQP